MTVKEGSVEQMVSRSADFFYERIKQSGWREEHNIKALEQMTSKGDDKRYLSIAEMRVTKRNDDVGQDYLVVVLPLANKGSLEIGKIITMTPGTLRSSSRETRNSIYINDIVLVPEEKTLDKIYILTYAVRRNELTECLLTNLQRIVKMLAKSTDQVRALSLSQAVIDCIEVLECSGHAELVLAGSVSSRVENNTAKDNHFLALVSSQSLAEMEDEGWWVRGSNLQWGKTAKTAKAATGTYMLLRYGTRPTQQSVERYIEELRRKSLKRDEPQAGDTGESYESYVEKEVEKRKQSLIYALYSHDKEIPKVTPLALEVPIGMEAVFGLGTAPDRPFALFTAPDTPFQKLFNEMGKVFETTYGVELPELNILRNKSAGTFIIMINEVPLVRDKVFPKKLLCNSTEGQLKEMGVKAKTATNPANGSECSWISMKDIYIVLNKGFKIWHPTYYILNHLESLLRLNLSNFWGTHEIAKKLEGEDGGELLNRLHSTHGGLARFKNVIYALLDEELPAKPLPLMATKYLEMVDLPVYEIAEELRCLEAVNTHLLKDMENWRIFTLADDYVEFISRHLIFQGDAALLAIEPKLAHEALTAVKNAVNEQPSASTRPLILIEDCRLRPFIRKLIEFDFPLLKVVAQREIAQVEPGLIQPIATISLDG